MGIFNIKKDIRQIKEAGRKIEEKAPTVTAIVKSIFVIIKWIVIAVIILFIILLTWSSLPKEKGVEEVENAPSFRPLGYQYQTLPFTGNNLQWSFKKIYDRGKTVKSSKYTFRSTYQTTGKFIEVIIIVENESLYSIGLPRDVRFKVKDDKERTYEEFRIYSDREEYSLVGLDSYKYSLGKTVKPSIPYEFSAFFEVGVDSEIFYVLVGQKNKSNSS